MYAKILRSAMLPCLVQAGLKRMFSKYRISKDKDISGNKKISNIQQTYLYIKLHSVVVSISGCQLLVDLWQSSFILHPLYFKIYNSFRGQKQSQQEQRLHPAQKPKKPKEQLTVQSQRNFTAISPKLEKPKITVLNKQNQKEQQLSNTKPDKTRKLKQCLCQPPVNF